MSLAHVTFLFSDGVSKTTIAEPGELLTEVASRMGLSLFVDCKTGKCGTCTGHLASGEIEMGEYDPSVLPESDRLDGVILPCVARLRSSCVVEFMYESLDACADVRPPFKGRITSCGQVAEEIWNLKVAVPEPLHFMPGQYVRLSPGADGPWRAYSMSNAPDESELSFYVRIVPGGAFSTWLTGEAKVGDGIEVEGPLGAFFLRHERKPRLFVAGGSGLAPFLSMLRAMGAADKELPTTVLVGARSSEHLFGENELQAVQAQYPGLLIRRFVERGGAPGCDVGYPTAGLDSLSLDPGTRIYVCGPPPMVDAVRAVTERMDIGKSQILFERFG